MNLCKFLFEATCAFVKMLKAQQMSRQFRDFGVHATAYYGSKYRLCFSMDLALFSPKFLYGLLPLDKYRC